jgi:hypothetical protein
MASVESFSLDRILKNIHGRKYRCSEMRSWHQTFEVLFVVELEEMA